MQPKEIFLSVGDDAINTCSPALAMNLLCHIFPELAVAAPAAQPAPAPAPTTPPAIGEYWPGQGGVFAGTMRARDGRPAYHLVVPTGAGVEKTLAWGGQGKDSKAISRWDGLENTQALLASRTGHPAAEWAGAFEHEGHRDFYLPAQAEMALLMANVADLFGADWYWSSTQYSAYYAYGMDFEDGWQDYHGKDLERPVRLVRRIPVIH